MLMVSWYAPLKGIVRIEERGSVSLKRIAEVAPKYLRRLPLMYKETYCFGRRFCGHCVNEDLKRKEQTRNRDREDGGGVGARCDQVGGHDHDLNNLGRRTHYGKGVLYRLILRLTMAPVMSLLDAFGGKLAALLKINVPMEVT